MTEGANTRLERGAGRVQVDRIPYVVEKALGVMREAGNLVLVGAREPVAFFAYPDKPSLLMPQTAQIDEARRPRRRHARGAGGAWRSSLAPSTRRRPVSRRRAGPRCRPAPHVGGNRLHPRRNAARGRDRRR